MKLILTYFSRVRNLDATSSASVCSPGLSSSSMSVGDASLILCSMSWSVLRSSVTFRRVKFSTLVSSESMDEINASSVMVEESRTTPFVLVGAGVVRDICRLSISALK